MKYRVICPDGKSVIIEASNMENARTIARSRFGQLPNDINHNIVSDILSDLSSLIGEITNNSSSLRQSTREYDWEAVYSTFNNISDMLSNKSAEIKSRAGSMVKINNIKKENTDEEI